MKIYRTTKGIVINHQGDLYKVEDLDWDSLVNRGDLYSFVAGMIAGKATISSSEFSENEWRAPIQHQEIWAAGVTYLRSREARMEESKPAVQRTFMLKYMRRSVLNYFLNLPQKDAQVPMMSSIFGETAIGMFPSRN